MEKKEDDDDDLQEIQINVMGDDAEFGGNVEAALSLSHHYALEEFPLLQTHLNLVGLNHGGHGGSVRCSRISRFLVLTFIMYLEVFGDYIMQSGASNIFTAQKVFLLIRPGFFLLVATLWIPLWITLSSEKARCSFEKLFRWSSSRATQLRPCKIWSLSITVISVIGALAAFFGPFCCSACSYSSSGNK